MRSSVLSSSFLTAVFTAVLPTVLAAPVHGETSRLGAVVERQSHRPLRFERNAGQAQPQVRFVARAPGFDLILSPAEAVFVPHGAALASALRWRLVGADPAAPMVEAGVPAGVSHYLFGNDPARWWTHVPSWSGVRVRDAYPGVDLVYRAEDGQLEYDFILEPGANPRQIEVAIEGADRAAIESTGDLITQWAGGTLRHHRPTVYQEQGGRRQPVDGAFEVRGHHRIGFRIGRYDPRLPLVIDPLLTYSTYLGGNGNERAFDIAVDASGSAYVVGSTNSFNFPGVNPFLAGHQGTDVFVSKLDPAGSSLEWSVYLGGSGFDGASAVAVDGSGNVWVTGFTSSPDFPTLAAIAPSFGGVQDAFVLKLDVAGIPVCSTFLGGSGSDRGNGVAVDPAGHAYVTGETRSADFPTEAALQPTLAGADVFAGDAFVARLSPSGGLVYSTFLGGSAGDIGRGIAVDAAGEACVTGLTVSADFPLANPLQPSHGGSSFDAFVTRLASDGSSLVHSTFLGGIGSEEGNGIAVDATGNSYVVGDTQSSDFPVTPGALKTSRQSQDAFITKLSPSGSSLSYSTFLGGIGGDDLARDVAVDAAGNAYVVLASSTFPMVDPIQPQIAGQLDLVVAKLNATGSALVYSTYLGGSFSEQGNAIAVDPLGAAYVTGTTNSQNFPTVNPLQGQLGGSPGCCSPDAVIAKIADPQTADLLLSKAVTPDPAVTGTEIVYTLTVVNSGPAAASSVTMTDDLPPAVTLVSCGATGGGSCAGPASQPMVSFDSLSPGASEAVTLSVLLSCSLADGAAVSNTASLSAAYPTDPDPDNDTATVTGSASNPPPLLACPADVTVPDAGTPGEVVGFAPSVSDNCPGAITVCSPVSGSMFAVGTTPVSCMATDSGGATTACSFAVTVLTSQEQTAGVVDQVQALVVLGTLDPGEANALVAKLEQAIASLDRQNPTAACQQLAAFIHQVEALVASGDLTPAEGQSLIAAADSVRARLGCQ